MRHGYSLMSIALFFGLVLSGGLFAQDPPSGTNEYRLAVSNPRVVSGQDTITADAGRGMTVAHSPDLDNDGLPEFIVTEYVGARVFVYELVGNDSMELVFTSKFLDHSNGSTPRTVTTGDFDNDGLPEIIFPVGYSATDSASFANRGIYFYEWDGVNDNGYPSEPTYKMGFGEIDSLFDVNLISTGRTESGLRVQDIDGDGKNELLFPPRSFGFDVPKLYIMEVESGDLSDGTAQIDREFVYEDMVQPPVIAPDGYVPVGTAIGDVDGDGLDEIVVAGWTNISAGAGLGFIEISGVDTYTPGSIVPLANFSAFVVKANPYVTEVNGDPVIYVHGTDAGTGISKLWTLDGIISDQFVSETNISEVMSGVGYWSAWAIGNQDGRVGDPEDGHNLYLYGGSGRMLDIEYDGSGNVTDSASYSITEIVDLADYYSSLGGLWNDVYVDPGMDLDGNGKKDIAVSYKGSGTDSMITANGDTLDLARNGFHAFMFEFGDSAASNQPGGPFTAIRHLSVITPEDYQLEQNYPNPFNPTTTIEFSLPVAKNISLTVYNSLGQEVRSLVGEQRYSAGSYAVDWDGRDNSGREVASGVYIYTLKFGNFATSRKMTLIR